MKDVRATQMTEQSVEELAPPNRKRILLQKNQNKTMFHVKSRKLSEKIETDARKCSVEPEKDFISNQQRSHASSELIGLSHSARNPSQR